MADLSDIQSAQAVKIVGASGTGVEQTPVLSTAAGAFHINFRNNSGDEIGLTTRNVQVSDMSDSGGVQGPVTVGTSAVLINVSGSNLTNRKNLTLFNNSTATLYWGYDNTVTTSSGTPIFKDQFFSWRVGPNTNVYAIAGSNNNNTRVTESA